MHEYSLVMALLEQLEVQAAAHPGARVRRVTLRVGSEAGVVPELLATAFEIAREGTLATNAELILEPVVARWGCTACGSEIASGERLRCSSCGGPARLVAGDELDLLRMELEVP